jgi:hypothetical protein
MINFDTKTYFIIIIIICLGYINLILGRGEKFDLTSNDTDSRIEQEIQKITEEIDSETQTNKCDTESLESCGICKNAYDNYNLYPSTNPFVVRGNDINMNFNNIIDNPVTLSELGTKNYQTINNIIKYYNPNDIEMTQSAFNELLTSSPLKTGCCFRNKDDEKQRNVLVRVPLNPNENVDTQLKKFDFKFKSLTIPENSCPTDYYSGSNECNTFFDVYCSNLVSEFNKLNLPLDNFTKYAPECACYAPKTDVQKIYPDNTPPACYKTNCDNVINPIAYVDPISRNNPCDLTVCNNIFNANNITAGGNVTIDAKLENACGNNLPTDNKPSVDNNKPSIDNNKSSIDNNKPSTDNNSTNSTNSTILYVMVFVVIVLVISGIIIIVRK